MAKKSTNTVPVAKGTLWKKGTDQGFNTLNDAIAHVFKCCGPDCCENVLRFKDIGTGVPSVLFIENGAVVVETEEVFKART